MELCDQREIGKETLADSFNYPKIKDWFLKKYLAVADFHNAKGNGRSQSSPALRSHVWIRNMQGQSFLTAAIQNMKRLVKAFCNIVYIFKARVL